MIIDSIFLNKNGSLKHIIAIRRVPRANYYVLCSDLYEVRL